MYNFQYQIFKDLLTVTYPTPVCKYTVLKTKQNKSLPKTNKQTKQNKIKQNKKEENNTK